MRYSESAYLREPKNSFLEFRRNCGKQYDITDIVSFRPSTVDTDEANDNPLWRNLCQANRAVNGASLAKNLNEMR